MSRDGVQIIGVHGLSVLFHHIVCDIYQIVDGPDAACRQPSLHPFRRWRDPDIRAHSCTVTGTQVFILNFHFDIIVDIPCFLLNLYIRFMERLTEGCRRLSGDTDDAVAVHPVGRDLILKHRVPESQRRNGIFPDRHGIIKNIDTVFRRFRIKVPVRAQLLYGTHHPLGRHSAKFPCLDRDTVLRQRAAVMAACHLAAVQYHRHLIARLHIRRAGHDLNRLLPDIHLADNQFIRVGMRRDLRDLTNHDLLQIFIRSLISFTFCAGQGHRIAEFLIRALQFRHICFNP